MVTIDDPLVAKLVCRLSDADSSVRRNVAGALRLLGRRASSALEALAQRTADEDPRVRSEAARALQRLSS